MKTARSWGLALLALAFVVHVGVTRPAQQAAAASADRYSDVRRERREAARRLAEAERRAALLQRASVVVAPAAAGGSREAVQKVRSDVVRSLRDSGVGRVRLEVRPAAPPVAATVSIRAEAGFFDLLGLAASIIRPGAGLVLERMSLSVGSTGLLLQLDASALSGSS